MGEANYAGFVADVTVQVGGKFFRRDDAFYEDYCEAIEAKVRAAYPGIEVSALYDDTRPKVDWSGLVWAADAAKVTRPDGTRDADVEAAIVKMVGEHYETYAAGEAEAASEDWYDRHVGG